MSDILHVRAPLLLVVGSWYHGKISSLSVYFCQVIIWRESDARQSFLWRGGEKTLLIIWATGLYANLSMYVVKTVRKSWIHFMNLKAFYFLGVLIYGYFHFFCALQFHYAVFFAYMRLREQEIRNLMWISECVAQNQKSRVHDSVVFIF